MTTYYKVDANGIFLHTQDSEFSAPYSTVTVSPPSAGSGNVSVWTSSVPNYDANFGLAGYGSWSAQVDNRNTTLYNTSDGSTYQINTEVDNQTYIGVGTVPSWLTTTQMPQFGVWTNGAWVVDTTAQAAAAAAAERGWRDNQLNTILFMRDRHRDQTEMGVTTTLSETQYSDLMTYIEALRNWPEQPTFPNTADRPALPSWLTITNGVVSVAST